MSRFSRARQITDTVEALKTGRGDCPCMRRVLPPVPAVGCVDPAVGYPLISLGFNSGWTRTTGYTSGSIGGIQGFSGTTADLPNVVEDVGYNLLSYSTTDPDTGIGHLVMSGGQQTLFYVVGALACSDGSGFGSRIAQGSVIVCSFRAKHIGTPGLPRTQIGFTTYDQEGNTVGGGNSALLTITTSYQTFSYQYVAVDPDAYWCLPSVAFGNFTSGNYNFYLDNVSLTVT